MPGGLGIVGVGAIAEAIITGLCEGEDTEFSIHLSPRSAARASRLAARYPSVHVAESTQAAVERADIVLVCVRPPEAHAALSDLTFRARQVVISVMACIAIGALRTLVEPAEIIVRAIPLPAVARRAGLTAIHPQNEHPKRSSTPSAASSPSTTSGRSKRYLRLPRRSPLTWPISTRSADGSPTGESRRPTQRGTWQRSSDRARKCCATPGRTTFGTLAAEYATAGWLNEQFLGALRGAGTFEVVEHALDEVADRLESD